MKTMRYVDLLSRKVSTVYDGFIGLSFFKKASVVLVSFVVSLCLVILLYIFVDIPMHYDDFIVGPSTWSAEGKTIDLVAGPLFACVYVFLFGFLSFLLKKHEYKNIKTMPDSIHDRSKILRVILFLLLLFLSCLYVVNSKLYKNDLDISISIVSSVNDDYQIFYDTGSDFNERESIRQSADGTARFVIPRSKISRLRIDPGTKPGVIEINKICLSSGEDSMCFGGQELIDNFHPIHQINSFGLANNNLHIVSVGDDPQFIYTGTYFPYSTNPLKVAVWYGIFLGIALLLFVFYSKCIPVLKKTYSFLLKDYRYWILPFQIVLVDMLIRIIMNKTIIHDYSILLPSVYALIVWVFSFLYANNIRKKIDANIINYSIVASIMFLLLPLSVFSIIIFFDLAFVSYKIVYVWLTFIFVLTILTTTKYYEKVKKRMTALLFIAQLSLPFLLLNLVPKRLNTLNLGEVSYYYSWPLYALVLSLIVISFYDLINRYRNIKLQSKKVHNYLLKSISPLALFAILIVVKMELTVAPSVSPDDYHFGENLLGTWSYLKGIVPYVDYLPPHGLFANDYASLLNIIFFDGLAGSFNQAMILASVLIGLFAFCSLEYRLKNIFLTFVIFLIVPWKLNWIVLVPFLCLWLDKKILDKPSLWIALFIITSPILVLLVPPQGGVMVASFLFVFVYCCYKVIKKPRLHDIKLIGIAFSLLLALILGTPLFQMFAASFSYLIENAIVNQSAYGISIIHSWQDQTLLFQVLVLELFRNTWVMLFVAFFILLLINFRKRDKSDLIQYIVSLSFISLMISYAMGRIDPSISSRPYLLSTFVIFFLTPIVLNKSFPKILHVTLFITYASYFQLFPNISGNVESIFLEKISTGHVIKGAEHGLTNLGVTEIQPDQLERLIVINQILRNNLNQEETYLDLSSRNAHYFFLNRVSPVPVTAPYNMVPIKQQIRTIHEIEKKKIPLAIFSADNIIHDGGGLALRTPILFRYIYKNYTPYLEEDIIYGIRNDLPRDKRKTVYENKLSLAKKHDRNLKKDVRNRQAELLFNNNPVDKLILENSTLLLINGLQVSIDEISVYGNIIRVHVTSIDDLPDDFFNSKTIISDFDMEAFEEIKQEITLQLLDRSFSTKNLAKIPISWGLSYNTLKDSLTNEIDISNSLITAFDIELKNNQYIIKGDNPSLSYNIEEKNISGLDVGVLVVDIHCKELNGSAEFQLSYTGNDPNENTNDNHVNFIAENGILMIPLDSQPRWLHISKLNEITLTLKNPEVTSSFRINSIKLYQRKVFEDNNL